MMKTKAIKFSRLLVIFFVAILVAGCFVGFGNLSQNNKQNVVLAAQTQYDNTTPIYEQSGIISSELWVALKNFYNNNKTDEMPAIKTGENGQYLTINQFSNFAENSILDLSNKNITDIKNLSIFDLSKFSKIDLSQNKIQYLQGALKNCDNLVEIDLSNNELYSFEYTELSQNCYSQKLQKLDISQNNIITCNLIGIANADIVANNNYIIKDKLTLPSNANLKVDVSFNLVVNPDLTNTNIDYGFQGAKKDSMYVKNSTVGFYGIDGISKVEIYKTTISNNQEIQTKIAELEQNQTHSFDVGYYTIKFVGGSIENIDIYIAPQAPTIKMFRNGEEIELTHKISYDVEIRIYGEDGAVFAVGNRQNIIEGNSIKVVSSGEYNIEVYQIVDGSADGYANGYVSFATKFSLEYTKNNFMGYIFMLGAICIFGVVFYLIIKFLPNIASFKLGERTKKDDNNLNIK